MILLLSQTNETGLVRKSLQPAAKAFTLSDCREEAVKATMITEDRKNPLPGERGGVELFGASSITIGFPDPAASNLRISLVA